jgi:pimeloyl-ACP methyl ester carboxylesterase
MMKLKICLSIYLVILLISSGCSLIQLPGPQVIENTTTVTVSGRFKYLMTEDGVKLAANFYAAGGKVAVVFAHMGIADQISWEKFAIEIAQAGMPALTFDFRCYGNSFCKPGIEGNEAEVNLQDVLTAIRYLQEQGYERIACVGASMGASACLNASLDEDLAGLVFIAGNQTSRRDGRVYPRDVVAIEMPTLFMVADMDRYTFVIGDTRTYYEASAQPTQLMLFPENKHGTELFNSKSGDEFHQALMDFLLAIR